jgi:NitT/TauT family transport system permease protein
MTKTDETSTLAEVRTDDVRTDQDVKTETGSTPPPVVAGAHSSAALGYGDIGAKQRPNGGTGRGLLNIFLPNRAISPLVVKLLIGVEAAIALLLWFASPYKVLPRPDEVLAALQRLWLTQGLGQDLATSFKLNLEALGWATLISLVLSYLTVLPVFRPLVTAISKGRFLSLAGFSLVFTLIWGGGHPVKVALLVFTVTVFFVTSMAAVIAAIPKSDFDHARTLRMSEWRVVWEVVILGTADKAFEVLRQNAAIGWMMLTMVEGIVRGEGGIGVSLLNEQKHFRIEDVFAIQLLILIVGLLQDFTIGVARRMVCPYADITLERK